MSGAAHTPELEIPSGAIPAGVMELCERFAEHRFRAWIVGGCIRDLLMGRPVSDWDLATDAPPQEVRRIFKRTIPTGLAHGTVTVLHRGEGYEVTTLRVEGAYTDGRRPDAVAFVSDIEEDLARRDFTVNAIAFDPLTGGIVDPWGGCADLQARVIRAVRDARERFDEDGLRAMRAARFAATLEFELDAATESAIPATLSTLAKVSPERVLAELTKMLLAREPSRGLAVLDRTGMLQLVAPPVHALGLLVAPTLARVDAAPRDLAIRLAALLYGAREAADAGPAVDAWLRELRASNALRAQVLHLTFAPPPPDPEVDAPTLRRWMRDVTRAHLEAALALERAAAQCAGEGALYEFTLVSARVSAELQGGAALAVGDLAIGGHDVMASVDRKPGRWLGDALSALLERVLDEPSANDKDALLAMLPSVLGPGPGDADGERDPDS